jgi:hypothetical protein
MPDAIEDILEKTARIQASLCTLESLLLSPLREYQSLALFRHSSPADASGSDLRQPVARMERIAEVAERCYVELVGSERREQLDHAVLTSFVFS